MVRGSRMKSWAAWGWVGREACLEVGRREAKSKEIGEDIEALRINPEGNGEASKFFKQGNDMARFGF